MKTNNININIKKDNIVLRISDETEYIEIINELKRKLPELKKFYNNKRNNKRKNRCRHRL